MFFLAAGRYLDANASKVEVPFALGSRHIAAASISFATKAIATVASEGSIVRVFQHGSLIAEIMPSYDYLTAMRLRSVDTSVRTNNTESPSFAWPPTPVFLRGSHCDSMSVLDRDRLRDVH